MAGAVVERQRSNAQPIRLNTSEKPLTGARRRIKGRDGKKEGVRVVGRFGMPAAKRNGDVASMFVVYEYPTTSSYRCDGRTTRADVLVVGET